MQTVDFFSTAFVEQLMQKHAPESTIQVHQVKPLAVDNSASILVVLTAGRTESPIGHFGLEVAYEKDGQSHTRKMVMKIKPHGKEIVGMLNALAEACSPELAPVYNTYQSLTGFQHTHSRELEVYKELEGDLMPDIFGLLADEKNELYIILMEYLDDVSLLNTVMEPEKWTDRHIKTALTQIAESHATYLKEHPPLNKAYWDDAPSESYMLQLSPLWTALLQNAGGKFPELYTKERVALLEKAIQHIPDYWKELAAMPKTFIHNDLNPRNSCFKEQNGTLEFCVYDWELATYHVPQYDVVEFLSFVLDESRYAQRTAYVDFYYAALQKQTNQFADRASFDRGLALAALDFGLHRLGMYMMAHSVSPYPFLPRVINSYFDTLSKFSYAN